MCVWGVRGGVGVGCKGRCGVLGEEWGVRGGMGCKGRCGCEVEGGRGGKR